MNNLNVERQDLRKEGAPDDGVLNHSVVARWDHHHLLWARNNLFMFLASESPWTNEDGSHVGVDVQDMNVLKRLHSIHGCVRHCCEFPLVSRGSDRPVS